MARYRNEDNVLAMFNRFYHMCETREQRTLVLDMKQAFLDIYPADVVPKSEVETLKHEIERIIDEGEYWQGKFLNARSTVAREIFAEIDEALQYEIDIEDTRGRNAWAQGDVSGFQTHEYAEDKLDTIKIALSLFKKKYTEGAQDENNT